MKKIKRIFYSVISVLLIFSVVIVPTWAATDIVATGSCGPNATYVIYGNGELVVSGSGETDNSDDPLEKHSKFISYDELITKIIVDEGITTIDNYLFKGCDVLESVVLPSTLTSIGEDSFGYCEKLKDIEIPSSVKSIGTKAFEYSFDSIEEFILPEGLEVLGTNAFYAAKIKTIVLPRTLQKIGDLAIDATGLTTVVVLNKDLNISSAISTLKNSGVVFMGHPNSKTESFAKSEELEFVSIVCDAPKLVSAVANVAAINLTWNSVSNALSYVVYRKKSDETKWTKLDVLDAGKTTYKDTTVKSGGKYIYTVESIGRWETGERDENGIFIKYHSAPTIAVQNSTKGVKISWESVKGAVNYYVYRKDSAGNKTKIATVTETQYLDRTAAKGQTYTYYVVAGSTIKGVTYKSYISNKVDIMVGQVAPAEITDAYVKKQGEVVVKWKAVLGATKYEVYRSTNSSKGYKKIAETTTASYTDKKVKLGQKYYYKIKTIAGNEKSASSSSKSVKATIPAAKFNAKVNVTKKTVKLEWSKLSSVDGYIIYRNSKDGWKKIATIKKKSTTSYTDKVSSGHSYKIVSYKKINGKTYYGAGNVAFFRPMSVATISVDSYGSGFTQKVDWNDVKNASYYLVYKKTGDSGKWKKISTKVYDSEYISKVDHGKYIYWKVKAVYTKDGYTSIGESSASKGLMISQNPNIVGLVSKEPSTSGLAYVSITNNGDFPLRILASGARIWNGSDYPALNGTISLFDGERLKNEKEMVYLKYLDIPAGKTVGVCFDIDGPAKAYYDEDSRVYFYFEYDGVRYKAEASAYWYGNMVKWEKVGAIN